MNFLTYAKLALKLTFRRSMQVTDRASVLLGPGLTTFFWLRGESMPEGLDGLIATGVLITAGAALMLRLLVSPYLIWKSDQSKINELIDEVNSEKRRQYEVYQKALDAERVELLKELSVWRSKAGSGYGGELSNAALFCVDPDFVISLDALRREASTASIISGQREMMHVYQQVGNIVETARRLNKERYVHAVDALIAILTGKGNGAVERMKRNLGRTEVEYEEALRLTQEGVSQILSQRRVKQ